MKPLHIVSALLLIAWFGDTAAPSATPRVSGQSSPDPTALLQRSIAAMKSSLQAAHATGKSTMTGNGQKTAFSITGSCALSGVRLKAQLRLKGTTIGDKKPNSINEEDGLMWSQSPGWVAIFNRPAGQAKAWQSIDPYDSLGAQEFGLVCPQIAATQLEQRPPVNLTLVGASTIGGEASWHLRSTVKSGGSTQTMDLYLGQTSLFLLRLDATANSSQSKGSSTVAYSALNKAVTIALPSVSPLPGRASHGATRLSDGRVLVLGGLSSSSGKALIENGWGDLYDPSSDTWTQVSGPPSVPITPYIGVAAGRRVLVGGNFYPAIISPQLFDPTTTGWTAAPKTRVDRLYPMLAVLKDDRMLIAGGYNVSAGKWETSAEIYDPVAGAWSKTGSLHKGRMTGAVTTLLKDGRLLVLGGTLDGSMSAEIFNPAGGTWKVVRVPPQPRVLALWTLPNGRVLAVGPGPNGPLATTIYDPSTDTYTGLTNSPVTTDSYVSVLLKNGMLLVAGGIWTPNVGPVKVRPNAWLLNPANGKWSSTGSMKQARSWFTLTSLVDGTVLASGGFGSASKEGPYNPLSSAEIYHPATGTWTKAASMK